MCSLKMFVFMQSICFFPSLICVLHACKTVKNNVRIEYPFFSCELFLLIILELCSVHTENQSLGSDSDIDFDPELFAIQSYQLACGFVLCLL